MAETKVHINISAALLLPQKAMKATKEKSFSVEVTRLPVPSRDKNRAKKRKDAIVLRKIIDPGCFRSFK